MDELIDHANAQFISSGKAGRLRGLRRWRTGFSHGWVRFLYLSMCAGMAWNTAAGEVPAKPGAVCEFTTAPKTSRKGEQLVLHFTTKTFCDVTVAIENAKGRILRHLASGVLGPNAPLPFKKNSCEQNLVWDGCNDQGLAIKEKKGLAIRVSLGLKPVFERTLYWSPKKRMNAVNPPVMAAAPEGVYVHAGCGVDHIRLFDHQGNYVRTVYPFPAGQLNAIKGLTWHVFPQDGKRLPLKHGLTQATLLTSGQNAVESKGAPFGRAAPAFAVRGTRMALVSRKLNRIATTGDLGEIALEGCETGYPAGSKKAQERGQTLLVPRSAAFSPDGKTLYATGYFSRKDTALNGVLKLNYESAKTPEVFAGSMKEGVEGTGKGQFRAPSSVACDAQGRVYVSDYMNDRLQIFSPEGTFLKAVKCAKPLRVFVHPENGEIYVLSWQLLTPYSKSNVPARHLRLGPFDNPSVRAECRLPFERYKDAVPWNRTGGIEYEAFWDLYVQPPTLWMVPTSGETISQLMQLREDKKGQTASAEDWEKAQIRLYTEAQGKLELKRDFAKDVKKNVVKVSPPHKPSNTRQRLFVNPKNEKLYLVENDRAVGKAFETLVEIDPASGATRLLRLPISAEDMAFDLQGRLYLRTGTDVARFASVGGPEVPFYHGEERLHVGFDAHRTLPMVGALSLPGTGRPKWFHLGGFNVSPTGKVIVSCVNTEQLTIRIPGAFTGLYPTGYAYKPPAFPGRLRWAEIHVWDAQGKLLYEDAVPGMALTDGLALDREDNIYLMAAANRVEKDTEPYLPHAETLIKVKPKAAKVISASKSKNTEPLPPGQRPKRAPDLTRGSLEKAWVEGAEWLYGGVGFGGFNVSPENGCACWNARFALDLFARSFAPEVDRFSVAVLDANGNLMTRIGSYGNVEDGKPLIQEGGPAQTRSIGGDEVALFHAAYLATHSDRRLFIADAGNGRILSVKLGYRKEVRVPLSTAR